MEIRISNSANRAQAILLAWQSGDLHRFRWEVDAAAALVPPVSNTFESERVDLLNGVAGELRANEQPLADPDTQICRDLLRHLAGASDRRKSWSAAPALVPGFVTGANTVAASKGRDVLPKKQRQQSSAQASAW